MESKKIALTVYQPQVADLPHHFREVFPSSPAHSHQKVIQPAKTRESEQSYRFFPSYLNDLVQCRNVRLRMKLFDVRPNNVKKKRSIFMVCVQFECQP